MCRFICDIINFKSICISVCWKDPTVIVFTALWLSQCHCHLVVSGRNVGPKVQSNLLCWESHVRITSAIVIFTIWSNSIIEVPRVWVLQVSKHFAWHPQKQGGLLRIGTGGEGGERVKVRLCAPTQKTREAVDCHQNTGSLKAVPPCHCVEASVLHNCCFNWGVGQSHKDNVCCTADGSQLEAKEVQLSEPSSTSLLMISSGQMSVQRLLPSLGLARTLRWSAIAGVADNTAHCTTVWTGVGKQLHTQPSHPALDEPQGF